MDTISLDLRGMEPPEPMERVLEALSVLGAGQQVRLVIDRIPHPLFRILERNGYRYAMLEPEPGLYDITISQRT